VSDIHVKLVEPFATDVNSNTPCEIKQDMGDVTVPIRTEAGSVLMSNISRADTIPPYVVPQGAQDIPVMRMVFKNNTSYTLGLDTLFVALKDAHRRLLPHPVKTVRSIELVNSGTVFPTATVADANPVPIIVAQGFKVPPASSDTLLLRVDIAEKAPAGEVRFDLQTSADVVFSISLPGGGAGPMVGVALEADGGDIAGHFLSGPLSVMSGRFEEYVHNYPNPFRAGAEPTKICYFLKQNARVVIRIYDLSGSLVWNKEIPAGEPGGIGAPEGTWCEVPWNGRNGRGELVRNGVYLCKVEAGSQSALIKIAVAK
jgi:hypothetical protein